MLAVNLLVGRLFWLAFLHRILLKACSQEVRFDRYGIICMGDEDSSSDDSLARAINQ